MEKEKEGKIERNRDWKEVTMAEIKRMKEDEVV